MRLSSSYILILAAKAIPYFTKTDLRRGRDPDPGRREWEELGFPETFIYRGDRYSFTGKTDHLDGSRAFLYESGQRQLWVGRDRHIKNR